MNEQSEKTWHLYILRCAEGKFYVGITTKTPHERFIEHKHKVRAAYWTIKYPPQEIIHTEDLGRISKEKAEKRENQMVRACIKKVGINNVRGGDLRDTEDYTQRFGWIMNKEDWKGLVYICCMLILISAFYVDKFLFVFIPGGLR